MKKSRNNRYALNTAAGKHPARQVALLGIFSAMAVVVSILEGFLPVMPIPGAKLGLSNIVTMAVLTSMGLPSALAVVVIKAAFAMLRGPTAGLMSLAGGLLSMLAMAAALRLFYRRVTFIGVGVIGAVAHNMGQMLMSMLLLSPALIGYGPWLLLMALPAGVLTGVMLNVIMPHLPAFLKGTP